MEVTDLITITELAKLTGKSRPTIYKFLTDYQTGQLSLVPETFLTIFDRIATDKMSKKDLYEYCENNFYNQVQPNEELQELFTLIKQNEDKIDIKKLKKTIMKEIRKR